MRQSFLLLVFITGIVFASCKKNSDSNNSGSGIAGFWPGKFYPGGGATGYAENFILKSDGTDMVYDSYGHSTSDTSQWSKAYGTYTVTGNTLTTTYTFTGSYTYHLTGTINTSVTPNSFSGNYSNSSLSSDQGTMMLTKQ